MPLPPSQSIENRAWKPKVDSIFYSELVLQLHTRSASKSTAEWLEVVSTAFCLFITAYRHHGRYSNKILNSGTSVQKETYSGTTHSTHVVLDGEKPLSKTRVNS